MAGANTDRLASKRESLLLVTLPRHLLLLFYVCLLHMPLLVMLMRMLLQTLVLPLSLIKQLFLAPPVQVTARFVMHYLILRLRQTLILLQVAAHSPLPMLLSLVTALSGMQALLLRLLRLEFLLQVLLLSAMLVL